VGEVGWIRSTRSTCLARTVIYPGTDSGVNPCVFCFLQRSWTRRACRLPLFANDSTCGQGVLRRGGRSCLRPGTGALSVLKLFIAQVALGLG